MLHPRDPRSQGTCNFLPTGKGTSTYTVSEGLLTSLFLRLNTFQTAEILVERFNPHFHSSRCVFFTRVISCSSDLCMKDKGARNSLHMLSAPLILLLRDTKAI